MSPITILGAGSWGTALACLIARNGYPVRFWGRDAAVKEMITSRRNTAYLPDVLIPDTVEIHTDFAASVRDVQDILIVVPSIAFRGILNDLYQIQPNARIAWATKGIDTQNNQLLHEVVAQVYGKIPMAIVAGPSFAKEVAAGLPTAITVTSNNAAFSQDLTTRLHRHHFRVYTQTDLIGVQICGAVKNCLAVATGISDGLGYGATARSALITRGLLEMTRLGLAMGGQQETFMGLAGVGDLVLTCTDNQSRNRRFGLAVGEGVSIDEAERRIGQVVEGKLNAFNVQALAKQYHVDMPITDQVCAVLSGTATPRESVDRLFAREQKDERIIR
jgi:glycerol-3-phosphate dehydrogenase (NAD(P)+)